MRSCPRRVLRESSGERRWVLKYLATLVRLKKWRQRTEPIHQGDAILPWCKGIVEEIYSRAD